MPGVELEAGRAPVLWWRDSESDEQQNHPVPLVTTLLCRRTDGFVRRSGDAPKGALTTMYDGVRPFVFNNKTTRGYQPMKKQGAIILDRDRR